MHLHEQDGRHGIGDLLPVANDACLSRRDRGACVSRARARRHGRDIPVHALLRRPLHIVRVVVRLLLLTSAHNHPPHLIGRRVGLGARAWSSVRARSSTFL